MKCCSLILETVVLDSNQGYTRGNVYEFHTIKSEKNNRGATGIEMQNLSCPCVRQKKRTGSECRL